MNPLVHTDCSISDSLKSVRKSVLIYETIIQVADHDNEDADRLLLRCQLEKSNSLSKSGEHGKAIEVLLLAIKEAVGKYETPNKITLELKYALALEKIFVHEYESSKDLLNSILPYAMQEFSNDSSFVYIIKNQLIRYEEEILKNKC